MDKDKLVGKICTTICIVFALWGLGEFVCKEVDLCKAKDLQIYQVRIELIKAKYSAGDIKVITGSYYN